MDVLHHRISEIPSPHFSSREGMSIEGAVVHYTAGGRARDTAVWSQHPISRMSWHFLISRGGEVIQQVPLHKAAWHAGASEMAYKGEMRPGANRFTIGIELANYGHLYQGRDGRFWYELSGHMYPYQHHADPVEATLLYDNGVDVHGWWEPYPDIQIDALMWLLGRFHSRADCQNVVNNVVGHEEIAMPFGGRKRDPGPLFPWIRIGRLGERRTRSHIEGRPHE